MRRPHMEQRIRIEVTLSYAARPRRTRRTVRRYLSTWLTWDVSDRGETFESFQCRMFKGGETIERDGEGPLPWVIRDRVDHGDVQDVRRGRSTLQKDWCIAPAHSLPQSFCVAVLGHKGWAENEENAARYAMAISFESIDGDLLIYNLLRAQIQSQVQVRVKV